MKKGRLEISRQRGFTIPEIVLAAAIFYIAVTGLLYAFTYGNDYVYIASLNEQVLGYLQGEMEKVTLYSNYGARDLTPLERTQSLMLYRHFSPNEPVITPAKMETRITMKREEEKLFYQDVSIVLKMRRDSLYDSLTLSRRFYLNETK